ncbi:DNA topoisomerase 6 subunit A [Tanacetum coccineum]
MSDNGKRQRSDVDSGSDDEGFHLCGYNEWCRSYKGELLLEISMKLGLAHGHNSATMFKAKATFYSQKKGCIILKAGKGLSDLATRLFVRQLLMRRKLYVYALVDTDRDGLRVLCDYGSIIPDLKWLGIRPSDLDKYEIPEECRLPMTNEDLKAGRDLLKEDFVKKNAAWVEELNLMEKMKQKVELQAFGTFHYNYLTEFYLPRKLEEI